MPTRFYDRSSLVIFFLRVGLFVGSVLSSYRFPSTDADCIIRRVRSCQLSKPTIRCYSVIFRGGTLVFFFVYVCLGIWHTSWSFFFLLFLEPVFHVDRVKKFIYAPPQFLRSRHWSIVMPVESLWSGHNGCHLLTCVKPIVGMRRYRVTDRGF